MARPLSGKQYTETPGGNYPLGRIRDKTPSIHGTPVNENVYGDFHQFFAKLADEAGVTLNGEPDNDYTGYQYIEALIKFIHRSISLSSSSDELSTGSTNLNDFIKPGVYSISNSFTNGPTGLGSVGVLEVSGISGVTTVIQRISDLTTGARWYRTYTAPTTYSSWTLVQYASKEVDLGTWNMTTNLAFTKAHGLSDYTKIRGLEIFVRNDAGTAWTPIIFYSSAGLVSGAYSEIGSTTFAVSLYGSGLFSSGYSSTGISRGVAIIRYEPH